MEAGYTNFKQIRKGSVQELWILQLLCFFKKKVALRFRFGSSQINAGSFCSFVNTLSMFFNLLSLLFVKITKGFRSVGCWISSKRWYVFEKFFKKSLNRLLNCYRFLAEAKAKAASEKVTNCQHNNPISSLFNIFNDLQCNR